MDKFVRKQYVCMEIMVIAIFFLFWPIVVFLIWGNMLTKVIISISLGIIIMIPICIKKRKEKFILKNMTNEFNEIYKILCSNHKRKLNRMKVKTFFCFLFTFIIFVSCIFLAIRNRN